MCAYPDVATADKDFEDLIAQVQAKQVGIQAVILISHDKDGNVAVQRTGDNLGRKGAKWGGGVGFLVGLAAPPLLAATAIGATGGAAVGKFAAKRVESGLGDMIGVTDLAWRTTRLDRTLPSPRQDPRLRGRAT